MNEATSDDLADGETIASGSIEFTLKFPKDVIDNVVVSLSKINTSSSVVEQNLIPSAIADSDCDSLTFYAGPDTNTFLEAGSYILKMELQQQTGSTDSGDGIQTPLYAKINTYTCLVRVAPGLCSKGEYPLNSLAKLYTITYECNDGNLNGTTIPTSYNAYTTFTLPTPTLSGHTFEGWYTDAEYTNPINNNGTFKLTSDTTVYAKWIKNVEGITYANNTLYISSYEGLKVFRDIVNGTLKNDITIPGKDGTTSINATKGVSNTGYNVVLQSNIKISEDWTPIGVFTNTSSQEPYLGTFNGNNKTITFDDSVKVNFQAAGLFGAISSDCNIYNLIIEGNIQSSSTSTAYAGGIVGFANGGSVQNCVNKAKIQGTWAGGIAGKAQNTSFNGCVNFGEITGTNYSAGIVGSAAANTSINLCVNIGNISSTTACGISGDAPTDIIVQNCINLGTLSASSFIYGISSVDSTSQGNIISSNISAGKFEGTVQYNCYAVSSSASNTNYYDNSICSANNFNTGSAIGKTTSEFSNLNLNEFSWLAAEGRYPLPNISENVYAGIQAIPDEIWEGIYDAAAISVSEPIVENAYYVSANGNDSNNGSTYDTPFKTLNKAITSANNSDSKTVYVIGTLNATSESSSDDETVFFIAASVGTADSPINIIGYPDSDATLSALDDTGAANKRVFETNLESYIKMKDLILTGGNTSKSGAAIYYYNGELTLEDCKISGNKTTYSANSDSGIYYDGIYMYGSSNKLNMKNTECTDGIYLYNCTANFDDDCLLGYDDSTEIPIMHINNSSLNLGDVYFSNSIYSDAKSPICLTTSLTKHSNDEPIYIKLPNNVGGKQIISATFGVVLSIEVKKFTLSDTNYTISDDGMVAQNSGGV